MTFTNAVDLIKYFEGFRAKAYKGNGEKFFSVGFGQAYVKEGTIVTREEASIFVHTEVNRLRQTLQSYDFKLNRNQEEALISFIYNIGAGAFDRSTCRRLLDEGDIEGAGKELLRWVRGENRLPLEGLVKRRAAELELFTSKVGVEESTYLLDIHNAVRYYNGETHQIAAWDYIWMCLLPEEKKTFTQKYRNQ